MKPELIVISHGLFAKEAHKSAEMIVGEIPTLHSIAMPMELGLDEMINQLSTTIEALPKGTPVIILADIIGGTPCNAALAVSNKYENTRVMTGLNLIMLIEYALSITESIDDLMEQMKANGADSISIVENKPIEFDGEEEYDE